MKKYFLYVVMVVAVMVFFPYNLMAKEQKILNGKILEINDRYNFVIINLGKDSGVKKGMVFMVYRDKKLLGKIMAEEIYPGMSSCNVLTEWMQGEFKIDDGVLEE